MAPGDDQDLESEAEELGPVSGRIRSATEAVRSVRERKEDIADRAQSRADSAFSPIESAATEVERTRSEFQQLRDEFAVEDEPQADDADDADDDSGESLLSRFAPEPQERDDENVDDFISGFMTTDFDGDGEPMGAELGFQTEQRTQRENNSFQSLQRQIDDNTQAIDALAQDNNQGDVRQPVRDEDFQGFADVDLGFAADADDDRPVDDDLNLFGGQR
jgi:hypothetical protein